MLRVFVSAALLSAVLLAQAPPEIDLSAVPAAQREAAMKILREESCTCGCGMNVAQCRHEDPKCYQSKGLLAIVTEAFRAGKTPVEVKQAVANSDFVKQAAARSRILGDPMNIPITGAPRKGPAAARIKLIEFSDFECPYCSKAVAQVEAVLQAYPRDVELIYKQFPLDMHRNARMASAASLAANEQGKFWEMHDKLFANSRRLSRENILAWGKEIGLDMPRFTADLDSGKYKAAIDRDVADGGKADVYGTPTLFVNGKRYNGAIELSAMKTVLDGELK